MMMSALKQIKMSKILLGKIKKGNLTKLFVHFLDQEKYDLHDDFT